MAGHQSKNSVLLSRWWISADPREHQTPQPGWRIGGGPNDMEWPAAAEAKWLLVDPLTKPKMDIYRMMISVSLRCGRRDSDAAAALSSWLESRQSYVPLFRRDHLKYLR